MKKIKLELPELVLIVGTRAMLGAGIALLLTERMEKRERRLLGWTLGLIGVLTTIPLAVNLIDENRLKKDDQARSEDDRLS